MFRDLVSKLTLSGEASQPALVPLAYRRAADVGRDRKGCRPSGQDLRLWFLGRAAWREVGAGDVWSMGQGLGGGGWQDCRGLSHTQTSQSLVEQWASGSGRRNLCAGQRSGRSGDQ